MNKNKIFEYILWGFIIMGIVFRFYNLRYNNQFNWDQENLLALPAWDIIINHKLTLIGAQTGVGNLYIGPLYSYIAAIIFWLLRMDPIAAMVVSGVVTSSTLIIGFFILRRIFQTRIALLFTAFWALSPLIFPFDRTPWNVNLLALSSIFIASGLWLNSMNEKRTGWLLTGLGIFLAINSHFSAVFLIIIVLLYALINRKVLSRYTFIPVFFTTLALAPLFIFNFRHENILGTNLLTFFQTSTTSGVALPIRMINSLHLTLETIGRILLTQGPSKLQMSLAIVFLCILFLMRKVKQFQMYSLIFILYLIVYIVGFAIYEGHVPDYYYVGMLPVAMVGIAMILDKIITKYSIISIVIVLVLGIFLYSDYRGISRYDGYSLGVKQQIIEIIKKDAGDKYVDINYDMEMGWSLGYNYLFVYYNVHRLKEADHDKTYWISYPKERFPGKPDYVVGDIALGLPKTTKKIYSQ